MMDCNDDTRRALSALQAAVLVRARNLAYEAGQPQLARLLDDAEYLPYLIAKGDPGPLRAYLGEMAERWSDAQFLERLSEELPSSWKPDL